MDALGFFGLGLVMRDDVKNKYFDRNNIDTSQMIFEHSSNDNKLN